MKVGQILKWQDKNGGQIVDSQFKVVELRTNSCCIAECIQQIVQTKIPPAIGELQGRIDTVTRHDLVGRSALLTKALSGKGYTVDFNAVK